MKRDRKIKRYNSLYRSDNRKLVLKIAGSILGIAGLFLAGWYLYEPVSYFILNMESPFQFSASSTPAVSSPSASTSEVSQAEASSRPEAPQNQAPARLYYFPANILTDLTLLQKSLDELQDTEVDGILFDLKDSTGHVLYQSALPSMDVVKAVSETTYDLPAVVKEIKGRGLAPVGRVFAFKDHVAPYEMYDAAVKYDNMVVMWIDNAKESGGKPWFNPYSPDAAAYILSIAEEAVAQGVTDIVFDGIQFPQGIALDMATYPDETPEVDRSQALRNFQDTARSQIEAKGARVWMSLSAATLLGQMPAQYGETPSLLLGGRVLLNVMPLQFGNQLTVGETTVEEPVAHPFETVQAVLSVIPVQTSGVDVVGMVQAYTAAGGEAYTKADVDAQLQALREAGIDAYLLYSPSGAYKAYH